MIKTDKTPLFAVIDIGSGQAALKIVQIPSSTHKIQLLENVTKTIPIGRDTFSTGRISPEMLENLCQILNGFRQLMREYKVRRYRAVATTAFREAKNREYILEQIKVQTHLNVEILGSAEERYYTQISVRQAISHFDSMRKEGLMIMHIGAGTLQLSGYGKEGLFYNQSFQLGSLRVRQLLSSIEENTLQFPKVLEEYVLTHMGSRAYPYRHFAVTGGIIDHLKSIGILSEKIKRQDFDQVYTRLLYMPTHTIISRYHLETEQAELIVPALILIRPFWSRMDSASLLCPSCSMADGILHEMGRLYTDETDSTFQDEIINGARVMAAAYSADEAHTADVMEKALLMFDKLAKSQGLTNRHRMLLEIAVLFHDTGKAIKVDQHDVYSAMLVASTDIIGLSSDEQKVVRLIVRYHEEDELDYQDEIYLSLAHHWRMVVSKLIAIMQLANAMDASHKQKLTQISLNMKSGEGKLRIRMVPKESYLLEKWMFERHAPFFHDVFGIEPQLRVQRGNQ